VLNPATFGLRMGLLYFFLVFLCHWVCRNHWLASAVLVLIFVALFFSANIGSKPVTALFTILVAVLGMQFVALRFGLLAFVAAFVTIGWLALSGWTLEVRTWYATGPNLAVAVMMTLVLYSAWTATGGRLLGKGSEAGD